MFVLTNNLPFHSVELETESISTTCLLVDSTIRYEIEMVQHHAIAALSNLSFQLDYQRNDKLVVSVG